MAGQSSLQTELYRDLFGVLLRDEQRRTAETPDDRLAGGRDLAQQ